MVEAVYESMPDYMATPGPDEQMDALRMPPHSVQAEQAVLGGLMLDNGAWDKIADKVGEHDFYRREHRLIFEAVRALADASQPFDVITVSEWLDAREQLEPAGGLAYLGELAHNTPSAANIHAYSIPITPAPTTSRRFGM